MNALTGIPTLSAAVTRPRGWSVFLVALGAWLLAGIAGAQVPNSLDQVTVSKAASGRTVVRFQLKNPPTNPPATFSIQSPPRIALDFLDTTNGLGATQRVIDEAALRSLNLITAGNRTRVVFNLNKPQSFETAVEGNAVIVTLNDQEAVRAVPKPFSGLPRPSPAKPSTRCATSIFVVAATARDASSSTCPTARPASTFASKDVRWWLTSSRPTCRATCSGGSTSRISARRSWRWIHLRKVPTHAW
jgi:hypothetical protein